MAGMAVIGMVGPCHMPQGTGRERQQQQQQQQGAKLGQWRVVAGVAGLLLCPHLLGAPPWEQVGALGLVGVGHRAPHLEHWLGWGSLWGQEQQPEMLVGN